MKINNTLRSDKIQETIDRLTKRINDRFPDSSLGHTSYDFHQFVKEIKENIAWIEKPIFWVRAIAFFLIALALTGIMYAFSLMDFHVENRFSEVTAMMESLINDILLLGAVFFFLFTLENRIKRTKALKLLNEIRGFAHVVDMHQLTRDPQLMRLNSKKTKHSPERNLDQFQLQRYLDYCSEFLSLIGKVAALYSQSLPDEVVVQSSSEIENLCSNISNKIWQKLIILNSKN